MLRRTLALAALFGLAACTAALAEEKEPIELFNGEDLSGWTYYLVDEDLAMEDVFTVRDGLIHVVGEPLGYLATEEEFESFKLRVEWRWPEGVEPTNSGVLMRITGEPMGLPRCIEAQLQHGNAGDIWTFQGFELAEAEERWRDIDHPELGRILGIGKIRDAEKAPGEWNLYEITLDGDKLTLKINGELVNEAEGVEVIAGQIGLQSEGGPIEFRTVELIPLD